MPSNSAWAFASLAWVSKPPKETDQTRVGEPAAMSLATTSNCCAKLESPPALPPFTVGSSSETGAGILSMGVTVFETLNKVRIEVAAAAISLLSLDAALANF